MIWNLIFVYSFKSCQIHENNTVYTFASRISQVVILLLWLTSPTEQHEGLKPLIWDFDHFLVTSHLSHRRNSSEKNVSIEIGLIGAEFLESHVQPNH